MFRHCLLLGLLVSLSSWVYAQPQTAELTMEEANRIFAQARTALNDLKYTEALQLLKQIEPIFKAKLPTNAPQQVELICLKALCHLKLYSRIPSSDQQQLQALKTSVSGIDKALLYFTLGSEQALVSDFKKARELYEVAIPLYESLPGPPHVFLARMHTNLGVFDRNEGFLDQALKNLNLALKEFEETLGTNHLSTAIALVNRGLILNELGLYDQAIQDHQRCLAIRYPKLPKYDPDLNISHLNLGLAYSNKGDYSRAEDYLVLAKEGMLRNGPNRLSYAYVNLGIVAGGKNNPADERAYYLKAIELEQGDPVELAHTYMNIGISHRDEQNLTEARTFFEKALTLFPAQHPFKVRCLHSLGLTYLYQNSDETAKSFFRLAMESSKNFQGKNRYFAYFDHYYLALVQLKQDSVYAALENNYRAQKAIGHQPGQAISNLTSLRDLCPLLAQELAILSRASALKLPEFNDQKTLALANHTLNIFDQLRSSLRGKEAKARIQNTLLMTFELALKAAKNLSQGTTKSQYTQQALQIMERSKAMVMLEIMRNADIRAVPNIAIELLNQEKDLRQKITILEERQQGMLSTQADLEDAALRSIAIELSEVNRQYDQLMVQLKEKQPQLFDPQYSLKTISLSDIQQKILRN